MKRYTIHQFNQQFPDDAACLEYLKNARWPSGITCPVCKRITPHHRIAKRPCYSCDYCAHHVYPLAGTIFHKSPTPLRSWFYAMFLMASTRCGISAKQLERELGVTYKTAWRMFKQIRLLMDEKPGLLSGKVEVDESYFGGHRRGRRGRGAEGKMPVLGVVQRKGRIVAKVTPDVSAHTIMPTIREFVMPRTTIFTDRWHSYDGLQKAGYVHDRIYHDTKVYVMGDIHTNTIEGFWSLVKRGIGGVHHVVGSGYLQNYLNTYTFRWNHRNDVEPMFSTLMERVPICSSVSWAPSSGQIL